jgi:hypothetical protein
MIMSNNTASKWTSPFKREDIVKALFDFDLSSSGPSTTPKPRPRRPVVSKRKKVSFLTLPVEIRLEIYDLLLVMRDNRKGQKTPFELFPADSDEVQMDLDILRTCKQIYDEASPILYSQNIFTTMYAEDITRLILHIGPANFKLIKHLDFYVPFPASLPSWVRLFNMLAQEASGLRSIRLRLDSSFERGIWCGGLGNNVFFVRALAKIQGLEELSITGYYAKNWPEYLEKKTGARVRAIAGHGYDLIDIDKEVEDRYRAINKDELERFEDYQEVVVPEGLTP